MTSRRDKSPAPLQNASGPLVQLGVFGAAHGVRGEVRVKSYTQEPAAIATYGPLTGSDGASYELVSVRPQKDMLVARVRGISDRNAAERLVNIRLLAPRSVLGEIEDEDEFFHADLIGLPALTPTGEALGRIVAVHDFGAGDLLEVAPEVGRSVYYPFTKAVVPIVDIKGGRVVIDPPVETGDDVREVDPPAPDGPPRRRGRP